MFRNGKAVLASIQDRSRPVGELLILENHLNPMTYQEMLQAETQGKRYPQLFSEKSLSESKVLLRLEEFLKELVFEMLDWQDGTFSFSIEVNIEPWHEFSLNRRQGVSDSGLGAQFLAMEGARHQDEAAKTDSLQEFLRKKEPAILENGETTATKSERPKAVEHNIIPFPEERVRRENFESDLNVEHMTTTVPSASAAAAQLAVSPAGVQESACRDFDFLVVDDDPMAAKKIAEGLARTGRSTTVACSAEDAIKHLESPRNWLVVCDLIMPQLSGNGILGGLDVLEHVAQKQMQVPFLMFSDYHSGDAEARLQRRGIGATIHKPKRNEIYRPMSPEFSGFIKTLEESAEKHARVFRERGPMVLLQRSPEPIAVPTLDGHFLPPKRPEETVSMVSTEPVEDTDPLQDISTQLSNIVLPPMADLPPPSPSVGLLGTVRSLLEELSNPKNRDIATLLVLRFATHILERAFILLVTKRAFIGLGGFSQDEPYEDFVARVKTIAIPSEVDSVLAKAMRYQTTIVGQLEDSLGNHMLLEAINGTQTAPFVVSPLVSQGRVVALLCGDNPSGAPIQSVDILEIFLRQAGLAIEREYFERKLEESS